MATASVVGVIGYLINPFLLNIARLTPFRIGIILRIKQIWDAVNDQMMGSISDRTKYRSRHNVPAIYDRAIDPLHPQLHCDDTKR